MDFRIVAQPIDNSERTNQVQGTDGKIYQSKVYGVARGTVGLVSMDALAAALFVPCNWGDVAIAAAAYGAVQPSAGQRSALLDYIVAINNGENTSTVESAINAL